MTDFPQPYAGLLLANQFDQQNKNRDDTATAASTVNGVHPNDAIVKAELSSNSSSNDSKDLQYIPRGNSNSTLPSEMASAMPSAAMHHSQSLPTIGHYGDSSNSSTPLPVFQGLLDPKAQYHKTLAEHSRIEKAQRKLQEEAHKQQQFYMQLLQQKSNELPESTRHQAEMLQLILSDPNMMHLLQNIFKGQQQQHQQQQHQQQQQQPDHPVPSTTPPHPSPKQPQIPATPLSSVPPVMSPAPPPSSPSLQNTFQYQSSHSSSSGKELSQLATTSSEVQFSEVSGHSITS